MTNNPKFEVCPICGHKHSPIAPAAFHKELFEDLYTTIRSFQTEIKLIKKEIKINEKLMKTYEKDGYSDTADRVSLRIETLKTILIRLENVK